MTSHVNKTPKLAFMFSGQGCQYAGMGQSLYATEPVFRDCIDRAAEFLADKQQVDLRTVLFTATGENPWIDRTDYLQPALCAMQCALVELWGSWGVEPQVVLGHSVGEIAACFAAGMIRLEDSLYLASRRGRLMHEQLPDSSMAAVFTDMAVVNDALREVGGNVSVAAINGPQQIVVSCLCDEVTLLLSELTRANVEYTRLNSSRAFHSHLIDSLSVELCQLSDEIPCHTEQRVWISTRTAEILDQDTMPADYWFSQAREPVRFADAVRKSDTLGCDTFVEMGPQATLLSMARSCLPDTANVTFLPSLSRGDVNNSRVIQTRAKLYTLGAPIAWPDTYNGRLVKRTRLPSYPFDRQKHWIDAPRSTAQDSHLVNISDAMYPVFVRQTKTGTDTVLFEMTLSTTAPAHLGDHRLFHTVIVPASAQLAYIFAALEACDHTDTGGLQEMFFLRPLTLADGESRQARLLINSNTPSAPAIQFSAALSASASTPDWQVISQANAGSLAGSANGSTGAPVDIEAFISRSHSTWSGAEFYDEHWAFGAQTGPSFRCISQVWIGRGEALARTASPIVAEDISTYPLYPGLIEACFQTLYCCKPFETARTVAETQQVYVPFRIASLHFSGRHRNQPLWCHARLREAESDEDRIVGNLRIVDGQGACVLNIVGFELRPLQRNKLHSVLPVHTLPAALESAQAISIVERVVNSPDSAQRRQALNDYLQDHVTRLTGFNQSATDTRASFVDIGIDSLMSVSLLSAIRADLRIQIAFAEFVEADTLEALLALLDTKLSSRPKTDSTEQLQRAAVLSNASGDKPPLICMWGMLAYTELARLIDKQTPVYRISLPVESSILENDRGRASRAHLTVPSMADAYLQELQKFQPRGPYRLIGYSFGGLIAFEVGQKLRRAGEIVETISLVDTPFPSSYRNVGIRRFVRRAMELPKKGPTIFFSKLWRFLFSAQYHETHVDGEEVRDDTATTTKEMRVRREQIIRTATQKYFPEHYPGRVVLFRAKVPFGGPYIEGDPYTGWRELCGDQLQTIEVSGRHLTLLREPNVRLIAQYMNTILNEN